MKSLLFLLILFSYLNLTAQKIGRINPIVSDITNFWVAYDSVIKTNDSVTQMAIIKDLYLKKESIGLLFLCQVNQLSAEEIRNKILQYPKFWRSIRPYTLDTTKFSESINNIVPKFKKIYPAFFQPDFYFVIGALKKGGDAQNNILAIGIELAASNRTIDYSELPKSFQERISLNIDADFIIAHECVHNQQKSPSGSSKNLLLYSIREGAADFIAELITKQAIPSPYLNYGKLHEKEIWFAFKKDMTGNNFHKWLWNSRDSSIEMPDLGYFVGYAICKSYYEHSKNKQKAIQEIIDIDYSNKEKIEHFLFNSKYQQKWGN